MHFSEDRVTIPHTLFPVHENTTGHALFKTWKQLLHTGIIVGGGFNKGILSAIFEGILSVTISYNTVRKQQNKDPGKM